MQLLCLSLNVQENTGGRRGRVGQAGGLRSASSFACQVHMWDAENTAMTENWTRRCVNDMEMLRSATRLTAKANKQGCSILFDDQLLSLISFLCISFLYTLYAVITSGTTKLSGPEGSFAAKRLNFANLSFSFLQICFCCQQIKKMTRGQMGSGGGHIS